MNIAGSTVYGGNYRINLKNGVSNIDGVDQRVLYFPMSSSVNRDIRYAFDFDKTWNGLNLQAVFDFVPDTLIASSSTVKGISASGTASLAYDSQLANISVDIAGTASIGSYKVTLCRDTTTIVDTRTYRFGTADEDNSITRNFKSQIDLSQLYSGEQLTTLLESLKLDDLNLSLTIDFIAAGPIGDAITKNDVTLSGTRAIDDEMGTSSLSLTIKGTARESGNHYVNVKCEPGTENTIEEKYYYLTKGKDINRTLNFMVDSTTAALTLEFDFLPDELITKQNGSVDAAGIASKNFDTKSVSVDVKLSGNASEGTASGNYKVYLEGYETEYRMFYLKGDVTESAKYQLDLNNLDITDFKTFTPEIVIEFYPDIFSDIVNGVTATGRVAVYEDQCVVNVSLSTGTGYALETGYYTVSLRNEDNTMIESGEPKLYFEDGRVVDSMTFNVGLAEITDISVMKLNIAFSSNTSFIFEIDYYNELVIFGGEVNYGKDILYTLVKVTAKFESAPEKAKWFPTLNGRIDIAKQIPKKGTAPFYIALKYIGNNKDFIDKYLTDKAGEVDPNGVIRKFAYTPGDDPESGFTGDYIELKPRPVNTALKNMAKTFYDVNEQQFTNTQDATIEVLFGIDKGKKLEKKLENRYGAVFTEELAKDESYPFAADKLPAGTPGIIRIAPVNFVSKDVNKNGELEYLDKADLKENYEKATFASLPIKFKIGAQPKAPNTAKMGIDSKKPNIIAGISEKMGIYDNTEKLGELKKNMTVQEFDAMLIENGICEKGGDGVADKGRFLNKAQDAYEFDIRLLPIKDKKLMSAKAVLRIDKAAYDKVYVIDAEPEQEDDENEPE